MNGGEHKEQTRAATGERNLQEELEVRARQQTLVAELGVRALTGSDLSSFLQEVTRETARALKVEYCKVLEFLPEENVLLLRAGVGWKEGLVGHCSVHAGTESQAGYTLQVDAPVVVENLQTETRFSGPPLLLDHGVVSGISVVILGKIRQFGVLGAHSTRHRKFTENDLHFLQSVSNLVAASIERFRTEAEVLSREIQLRTLIENAPGAVYRRVRPPEWTTEFISAAIENITGYAASDFQHDRIRNFATVIHPDDLPFVQAKMIADLAQSSPYDLEYRILHASGGIRWVHDRGKAAGSGAGDPNDFVDGFLQDITALHERAEWLRLAVRASNVGLWERDIQTNRVTLSREWKSQLGYEEHEIRDHFDEWRSRVHPEDLPWILKEVRHYIDNPNGAYEAEYRMRHKDGSYRWIYSHSEAVTGAGGKPMRILGCHMDITKRKRAEELLRKSEETFSSAFHSSPAAFGIATVEGTLVEVNSALCNVLGYSREEMIGRTMVDLRILDPAVRDEFLADIQKASGSIPYAELKFRRSDGTFRDILFSIDTIYLRGAEHQLATGLDITNRKNSEEELRRSREQLRVLAARIQNVREEERTSLARTIHDELGQALTAMKMDLSWLNKNLRSDQSRPKERIQTIFGMLDTTIELIRKISAELRPGILDDLGLIAAMEWQAQEFEARTGIRCRINSSVSDLPLDRERSTAIFRILQESLTNVARHSGAGNVEITFNAEDLLTLKVRDDGRGITDKEISDSKSLGLLGIRERAYLINGKVMFAGTAGKGTTITLQIPVENRSP